MQEYRTVVLLFRNPKKRITLSECLITKEAEFKSLAKLYPTYKTKQRNENFKWVIQFLAITTYA